LAGGLVGGEAGKQIANAGSLVSGVTTAAATGDVGNIIGAATQGAAGFVPDANTAGIISGIGAGVGKATNAGISGDLSGALNAASGAASVIPGAGT
jgi:hypothetical protein